MQLDKLMNCTNKNKKIINLNLENWYLASGGLTVTENIIKEIKTSVK